MNSVLPKWIGFHGLKRQILLNHQDHVLRQETKRERLSRAGVPRNPRPGRVGVDSGSRVPAKVQC